MDQVIMEPRITMITLGVKDLQASRAFYTDGLAWEPSGDSNDDILFIPLNGRIAWTSSDRKWDVAAFGRNLGDQEYMVYAFDLSFFGFNEEMIGTPRMFGVEASYRL